MEKNVIWFKRVFIPLLEDYEIEYSTFQNGDFGDLERFEIEGKNKGGNVDFWSLGWLNVHLVDYEEEKELLNVLLEPHQKIEREEVFKKLQTLL